MRIIVACYAFVALLTFGYSYNADHRVPKGPYSSAAEVNSIGAMIAGLCWPLYWSVQMFREVRPANPPHSARSGQEP